MKPYPTDQLVKDWVAWADWANRHYPNSKEEESPYCLAFQELLWLVEHEPEKAWEIIQRIFVAPGGEPIHGNLAAGPVEDLLALHGEQFIERVESQAASDHKFALLLRGVWQFTMSDSIWQRVQRAAALPQPSNAG